MEAQRNNGIQPLYIALAVIISLLFHLFLIEGTGKLFISVPGVHREVKNFESVEPMLFHLRPDVPLEPIASLENLQNEREEVKQAVSDAMQSLPEMDINQRVEELFEKAKLYEPPKDSYDLNGVQKDYEKKVATEAISPDAENQILATAPRPEIIEIEYKNLSESRQNLPGRVVRPELERIDVAELHIPSLAAPSDTISMPHGKAYNMQLKSSRPSFASSDLSVPSLEAGPGDSSGLALPEANFGDLDRAGLDSGIDTDKLPLAFDAFVNVKVTVVRDKNGLGGFFEVAISPNANSDAMKDIPKDVLFILDRSSSISRPKFEQFKLATLEAIGHLNGSDRFNIVSFTDTQSQVFKEMAPASGRNIQEAEKAINSLIYGGRTDVFGGVAPYVRRSNGNMDRPFNIFLLTDGQSTVNIFKSTVFLRQIVSINPGNVSIYPFSAGKNANRQLLDYLGYLNRGGKFHVERVEDIRNSLVNFISAHSSLVIMDLKYTANAQHSQQIYPRTLPHLYRGETLKLFGRFEDINDELVLSLTGRDADLKTRDFMFRRSLNRCEQGRETLPYEWAAQKILWLSALKHCSEDAAQISRLDAEIASLRTHFRVYTLEGE